MLVECFRDLFHALMELSSSSCTSVGFYTVWRMQAVLSLLNFYCFPPDCLCKSRSQPPSIRRDVKYRARRTRIERSEREVERWRVSLKAPEGEDEETEKKSNRKIKIVWNRK